MVVREIESEGPASKSDLRPGDVITAVDDKSVKTSRQLKDEIAAKSPGHVTVLNVVRARQHLSIKVTVAALPSGDEMAAESHRSNGQAEETSLGLTVKPITKELAGKFGIDVIPGVIVTAVQEDSAAEESGLKPGDVITEINRKKVATPTQFRDAIRSADSKGGIMINLISEGASRFVVLKNSAK